MLLAKPHLRSAHPKVRLEYHYKTVKPHGQTQVRFFRTFWRPAEIRRDGRFEFLRAIDHQEELTSYE